MKVRQIKLLTENKDVRDEYIKAINQYKLDKSKMDYKTYLKLFEKAEERYGVRLADFNSYLKSNFSGYFIGGNVVELKPWEVAEFPWGTAVRHRGGKWTQLFIRPLGQRVDVEHLNVILHDNGIEFVI